MADAPAFSFVAEQIESITTLDRLEARGTVRLAVKEAGFSAASIGPEEMAIVVDRVLPKELEGRGVRDSAAQCATIREGLSGIEAGAGVQDSPAVAQVAPAPLRALARGHRRASDRPQAALRTGR